jgi:hypothetical protein
LGANKKAHSGYFKNRLEKDPQRMVGETHIENMASEKTQSNTMDAGSVCSILHATNTRNIEG